MLRRRRAPTFAPSAAATAREPGIGRAPLLALQRAVGNRVTARLLRTSAVPTAPTSVAPLRAPAGLIQPVREKLAPASPSVSVDSLTEYMEAIEAQLAELDPGEVEDGFIDLARVEQWRAQYAERLTALRAELGDRGDDFTMPWDTVAARGDALAQRFHGLAVTVGNLRGALNRSFAEYRAYVREREARESASAEWESFEKQKALEAKLASARGSAAAAPGPSEAAEERVRTFPHKGKHAPPRGLVGDLKGLEKATADGDQPALYLTNDPPTVVGWEDAARVEGLLLRDGFTVVHRFGHVVGADQGSQTQCVRIDGDHGHPIVESGGKTSFDSYIKRDVAACLKQGDHDALKRIAHYLQSVGLDPRGYGIPEDDIG
jgi:hypothetical protein